MERVQRKKYLKGFVVGLGINSRDWAKRRTNELMPIVSLHGSGLASAIEAIVRNLMLITVNFGFDPNPE